MKPTHSVLLRPESFRDHVVCRGSQLAAALRAIERARPSLDWYVADVQAVGTDAFGRIGGTPVRIGTVAELLRRVEVTDQFLAGVFVGFASEDADRRFRSNELYTDDEEDVDLGNAAVELRTFDTSYIAVLTCDARIAAALESE